MGGVAPVGSGGRKSKIMMKITIMKRIKSKSKIKSRKPARVKS
jgi:hypothetical protein